MPIHPIGVEGKKGSLGCPYSISDYRAVNPVYGTIDDLRHLVDRIHALGMKGTHLSVTVTLLKMSKNPG